ncbi:hypothetical protein [Paenibacillus ferrarius]|uniref:hypothetical protein n=1 Tax=Paenibacillus ferrarius TaxID=1469647 RepID=UPI003D27AAB5
MNPNAGVRFVVKKAVVETDYGLTECATLVLQKVNSPLFRPHPITDFIKKNYLKHDNNYNTQNSVAELIKRYLNYILIDNFTTYRLESFSQIRRLHALDFLESLKGSPIEQGRYKGKLRSNITLEKFSFILSQFYGYLHKKGYLSPDERDEIADYINNGTTKDMFVGNGFTLFHKDKPVYL